MFKITETNWIFQNFPIFFPLFPKIAIVSPWQFVVKNFHIFCNFPTLRLSSFGYFEDFDLNFLGCIGNRFGFLVQFSVLRSDHSGPRYFEESTLRKMQKFWSTENFAKIFYLIFSCFSLWGFDVKTGVHNKLRESYRLS